MQVLIGTERVRLRDEDLLGIGGEARVFAWKGQAVKVFHPTTPPRDAKLRAFPRDLPTEVIGPRALVTDAKGKVIGFTMARVQGEDLLRLTQRKWRQNVVSNAQVMTLFGNIRRVVAQLHTRGIVIGDFNDANVLFAGERPAFIDADSMQLPGHPCIVGHERFLDPRLYGVDLARTAALDERSDWYAYAVLLFSSLLYVHPYGGLHRGYPTLLRRAEARVSVLRTDVTYPRAAAPFSILPDVLLHWLEKVFGSDERPAFPEDLLRCTWTRCSCGTEHARAVCPVCTEVGVVVQATVSVGRCTARTMFETRGRILAATSTGSLRWASEEDGELRREDGSVVRAFVCGAEVAISGSTTWIAHGERLCSAETLLSTGHRGSVPVFAASNAGCVRTEGGWLLDVKSGMRLGQILEGHTWLWMGERLGLGFYRLGLGTFFFLWRVGQAGLVDVLLPAIAGRLVDARCVFDDRHALLTIETEQNGASTAVMYLVGEDGALLARAGDDRMTRARGKALMNGRVVCATHDGLLALRVDSGRFVEHTLFPDTRDFLEGDVELSPGPGGSLYVVGLSLITQLTLQ